MLSIYNRVRISLEVEDLEETKRETRLNNKCCYKEKNLFPQQQMHLLVTLRFFSWPPFFLLALSFSTFLFLCCKEYNSFIL